MAFCKICACGEKIVFERRMGFPDNCPSCGRNLMEFRTYREDDPYIVQRTADEAGAVRAGNGEAGADRASDGRPGQEGAGNPGVPGGGGTGDSGIPGSGRASDGRSGQAGNPGVPGSASRFALQFENGDQIPIPAEGGVVGRTAEGGELLAGYPSVSRQHVRITPRRSLGVILEDISTYGTLVDGKRLEKREPVLAKEGAVITLCDLPLRLVAGKEDET